MDMQDPATGEITETGRPFYPGIPPAVAAAIIAVKKEIRQLGSDSRNEHAKYSYVSVDKFYDAIGRIMADKGLAILVDETGARIESGKSGNPWLFIGFELRFVHESGASSPPLRRSLALPINGPQTYGAAQSYAEKQFLRQVFKVPTGEKDADDIEQGADAPVGVSGGRTAQQAPARTQTYPQHPQAAPPPSDASAEARKRYAEIRHAIDKSMTSAELDALLKAPAWAAMVEHIRSAESPEVARGAVDTLVTRAEKRREMLADQARQEAY